MKGAAERIRQTLRTNVSLIVIIVAALMLQLTVGVMYIAAQRVAEQTMEQMVDSEMKSIALSIRKQLGKVESATNNMEWVLQRNLSHPDSLYSILRSFVEYNPSILSCGIGFKPNYYPQKGYWFEPYAVHRFNDSTGSPRLKRGNWYEERINKNAFITIETMQLGSAAHDYTQKEFYAFTMAHDSNHWSEPYLELDGARTVVTTYSTALHDDTGAIIGVVGANISLEWLNGLLEEYKRSEATHRILLSREDSLLVCDDVPTAHELLEQLKDNKVMNDTVITDANGEKMHVFYNDVGGITDWTLVCVCSDRVAFSKVRKSHVFLLLLVVVSLFFVGFIVYRSSRSQEHLNQVKSERARIKGELDVASKIQQSMLPSGELKTSEVDIASVLAPAREVGGDLYDYYVRDEKLFFCIGDVSGKGAPSAMVMAVVHALFRVFSAHENNPARILASINESACRGNDSNFFLTFFIGVLDLPTGYLRYCDAGHEAPILLNAKQADASVETSTAVDAAALSTLNCNPHLPIGVFGDVAYNVQETLLQPGTTLFLYTDGLTEAKNEKRQQFGLQRTKAILASCARQQLTARQILENIRNGVDTFVADAEQSDDLTLLAIHYTPQAFSTTFDETIQLKSNIDDVPRLGDFVKSFCRRLQLDPSFTRQLRLAIEESVVNVIEYAYPDKNDGTVAVRMLSDGQCFRIVITDTGIPFDPTAIGKADTTLSAEDRQIGGLGILIVRKLMDTINYERENGKNILTLIKTIPQQTTPSTLNTSTTQPLQ